jgi:hypothetical protein
MISRFERALFSARGCSAALQWTGTFTPRPFDAAAALELYGRAYQFSAFANKNGS